MNSLMLVHVLHIGMKNCNLLTSKSKFYYAGLKSFFALISTAIMLYTCEFYCYERYCISICSRIMLILHLRSVLQGGCVQFAAVSNASHLSIVLHCHPQCVCTDTPTTFIVYDSDYTTDKINMQAINK